MQVWVGINRDIDGCKLECAEFEVSWYLIKSIHDTTYIYELEPTRTNNDKNMINYQKTDKNRILTKFHIITHSSLPHIFDFSLLSFSTLLLPRKACGPF